MTWIAARDGPNFTSYGNQKARVANQKSARYGGRMSAIGFSPEAVSDLDQLRAAYRSMNHIERNLQNAEQCIKRQDLKMVEAHLHAAEWHLENAEQSIRAVGQNMADPRIHVTSDQ